MSASTNKTIILYGEINPLVSDILEKEGYTIISTNNFIDVVGQEALGFNFDIANYTRPEIDALLCAGLISFRSEKESILDATREKLTDDNRGYFKCATKQEIIDERSVFKVRPEFYSNKDRFLDKRKWR